jgi:hypothetical protein
MSDSLAPFRLSIQKDPAPDIRCTSGEELPMQSLVSLAGAEAILRWIVPTCVQAMTCDSRSDVPHG